MRAIPEQHTDSLSRVSWILMLGISVIFLVVLVLTSEGIYVAMGFAAVVGAIASSRPRFRLMMLISLLPFAHAGFGISTFGGFGIFDVYSAVFLFFFLWRVVLVESQPRDPIPVLRFAYVMMAAFLPSLLNTEAFGHSTKAFVQLLGSIWMAAGVFFYLRREDDPKLLQNLAMLFALVAGGVSIYGIYEAYASRSILGILTGRAFFSLFQDANYYASYLLMALAISGGLALTVKEKFKKIVFSLTALLLTVTVVSTVSRSALVVLILLVFGFVGFLFVSQKGSRKYLGPAILVVFLATLGVLVFTDVGSKMVDLFTLSRRVESVMQGRDASFDQRMTILAVTQRVIAAHPVIGIGFGAFEDTFDRYQGGNLSTGFGRSAHNTALRILAETGAIGFIAGLIFVSALLWYLFRALRRASDIHDRTLMFSLAASIASFFMMSLSLDQMFEPHFWVGCGISLAMAERILRTGRGVSKA